MKISFPSDVEELNETDFDVLRCLYRSGPIWKMEITREINNLRSETDLLIKRSESITKQAVSRRVERLHEMGYVQSSVIALDSIEADTKPDRDFIEGYTVTKKGKDSLENTVRKVLRDVLSSAVVQEEHIECSDFLELYSDITGDNIESLRDFVDRELPDKD